MVVSECLTSDVHGQRFNERALLDAILVHGPHLPCGHWLREYF